VSAAKLALSRLTKTETNWGDLYFGTVSDLVAAGLVLASQVPGLPGNPKMQATYRGDGMLTRKTRSGDSWVQIRLLKKGVAEVRRPIDAQASRLRLLACQKRREQAEEAKRAEARLSSMPQTHEAFRAERAKFAGFLLGSLQRGACENVEHGFQYDAEELEELDRLCSEIVDLLKTGATICDRRRHHAAMTEHRAVIARADAKFSNMLGNLVQTSDGHDHA